jgi:hypothetical protein
MKNLRIKAAEYGEQQLEALGLPARLELELADGSTVEVVHPWLWGDDTEAAVKTAADETDEPYNTRYAKAVLGKKDHARFIKAGGKSSMIALAVATMKNGTVIKAEEGSDPKDPSSKDS